MPNPWDDYWAGRRGEIRWGEDATPDYPRGRGDAHWERRRPTGPPPGAAGQGSAGCAVMLALPFLAALVAAAAAAVSGHDIGQWAAAGGGVTFVIGSAVAIALGVLGLVGLVLFALVRALPALIVLAALAAVVLLALSAFGIGPGLTFL